MRTITYAGTKPTVSVANIFLPKTETEVVS